MNKQITFTEEELKILKFVIEERFVIFMEQSKAFYGHLDKNIISLIKKLYSDEDIWIHFNDFYNEITQD